MSGTLVGYVTALLSRDPSHGAAPFVVEMYAPAAPAGSRTRRFHLDALCDTRELAMVSVLRDAMVHNLSVHVSFQVDDRLDAVELHIPVRETYSEGPTHEISGRITWLGIRESAMGHTDRGQPDYVSVIVENRPEMLLILERRNHETKLAQLAMLQRAARDEIPVHIEFADYPVSPGDVQRVIVEVGIGTRPLQPIPHPFPHP